MGHVPKCLLYGGSLGEVVAFEIGSETREPWRARAIADLRSYTLDEIVRTIEAALGRRTVRLPVPARMVSAGAGVAESVARQFSRNSIAEIALAARTALYPVRCAGDNLLRDLPGPHVDLMEGVHREVEWMRASGNL
jgi:hypothetical protein